MFLVFKGHCIRVTMNINNSQILQRKEYTETNLDSVLTRILTAWTIPVHTGNKNETLHVIKLIDNEICECYLSRGITYMENKVWHSDSCSCEIKHKIFIMTKQSRSLIPKMLVSCDDGNFHDVTNRCDGIIDCQLKEDEDNCSHVCSKHINCTSNCTLPNCICAPLYHHCTLGGCVQRSVVCDGVLGGCVQRSVVCDGVVDCVNDDSDELACNILPNPDAHKKQLLNHDVSYCNSFSNKTYPNTEICPLVRDVYGVTKHCPNTEHLHYCADFRCPNHYKCQDSYCIPLHTVCDGVKDCPEGQDEDHCRDFTCRGFVRCKGMQVCIHTDYLCNGIIDCPLYGDDEMFCDNLSCPNFCKCFGFTVSCAEVTLPSIKYISILAQSKAIALINCMFKSYDIMFKHFQFLQILNLSNTYFMESLYPDNFAHMTQLRILDLTNASINLNSRKIFTNMNFLMHFYLAHTHASRLQLEIFRLQNLISLQLQHSEIKYIENMQHCSLANLKTLNVSFNNIKVIHASTFLCLEKIDILDLSNNNIQFIAAAALDGTKAVRFSRHLQLCCYVGTITSCQVGHRIMNNTELSNECQPILQFDWMRITYGVIGLTSTILSIIFIVKFASVGVKEKSKKTLIY